MNYKIAAYNVEFPHKAYGVQLGFMEKVLKALDGKANALLEAPTGSGKTLSLLCAALAWQREQRNDAVQVKQEVSAGEGAQQSDVDEPVDVYAPDNLQPKNKPNQKLTVPKIYYATRTHSQIAQVVRELKRTAYRPKMAILASKEHYCVHPTVSKKANKDEECQNMLKGDSSCRFFKNVQKLYPMQTSHFLQVHDIEDLTKVGKEQKACPYYAATHFAGEADLVFCPYSYLLDPVIRSAMKIDLDGSVLIFDEAHNIEDVSREAASAELELEQLQEVQLAFQKMQIMHTGPENIYDSLGQAVGTVLQWLNSKADGTQLNSKGFQRFEKVWETRQALTELEEAGLSALNVDQLWDLYTEARKLQDDWSGEVAANEEQAQPAGPTQSTQANRAGMFALGVLSRLLTVLQLMYSDKGRHVNDYRLAVQKWFKQADKPQGRNRGRNARTVEYDEDTTTSRWALQLCLWSLNPAVAFKALTASAHSVILTSGTLAPVDSFASELGASFPIKLEAPHVVDTCKQVWAGAIGSGPDGTKLQATFKHTNSLAFQDSMGQCVVEVCKVVPHGVLMFLPSYSMLDKLTTRWKATDVWEQLAALKKVVSEPKGTGDAFDTVMKDFYTAVRKGRGALFIAVYRGKVSEGLDFADNNARAVLIVGIPFPHVKDPKVEEKKKYNDAGMRSHHLLSGDAWYNQQAFRALNQAIGRCIRHRADYGAIILLDDRFRETRFQKNLSRWVKATMTVQPSFGAALKSMTQFFARLTANPPAPLPLPLANPVSALTDPHAAVTGQPDQANGTQGPSASQPTLKSAWAGPNSSAGSTSVKPEPLTQRQQWQAAMSARASAAASSRLGQVVSSPAVSAYPPMMAPPPARLSSTSEPDEKDRSIRILAPSSAAPAQGIAPVVAPHQQQQCAALSCNSGLNQAESAAQAGAYACAHSQAHQLPSSYRNSAGPQLPQQPAPHQVPQASAGVHHTQQGSAMQHLLFTAAPPQIAMHHLQHPAAPPAHVQLAQHVQYASPLPNLGGQDHMSSVTPASRLRPHTGHGTAHPLQPQHGQQFQHAQQAQPGLHAQHDCQGHIQQPQHAQHNVTSASGASPAQVLDWVRQDLTDFTTWVSNHEIMQSQLEAEDIARSGLLECFDMAKELLGGQSQLTAFLSEWDGPLPRGFRALASAKGISLRHPCSPPAACLQAMHQKLGHVFLPESLEAMKQDYVTALADLPALGAQSMMPTSLHMGNSTALQPLALDPSQGCQPSGHCQPYREYQMSAAHPQPVTGHADPRGSTSSTHRPVHFAHAGLAIQQQQHASSLSSDQPRSALNSHQHLGKCGSAVQPAAAGATGRAMQDTSQLLPDEDICCAQLATHAQPALLLACNSLPQQGDTRTLPHYPQHVGNNSQCNNPSQAAASRLSVASSASTSGVSRQNGINTTDQQRSGNSSRPRWMRGGDQPSAVTHVADSSALVQQQTASSAAPEKENARPVNPKRILKSKAAAAAEAERENKRSKALTSKEALAEAKAAALAADWSSGDDDFETLPKR